MKINNLSREEVLHMGNRIFSTYPIPLKVWLILIPFAFILFAAEELRKFLRVDKYLTSPS